MKQPKSSTSSAIGWRMHMETEGEGLFEVQWEDLMSRILALMRGVALGWRVWEVGCAVVSGDGSFRMNHGAVALVKAW